MEIIYIFGGFIVGMLFCFWLILKFADYGDKPIDNKQLNKYRYLKISDKEAERIKRGI